MANVTLTNSRIKGIKNKIGLQAEKSPLGNTGNMVNLNVNTDPTNASTTIEFLLSTLVSKMGLKSNQALALLSNSNALLIHVIIKGLKRSYYPVINWYKELLLHCKFTVSLFENESEGLTSALRVLDIIKIGLYSKCIEVANLAMRLMGRTATEMNEIGMNGVSWDWFVSDNGGLKVLLKSIENNKELINENLVSIFCQFGRNNFIELFTHNILTMSEQKAYMDLIMKILEPLRDYKLSRDELIKQGVISFWINFACHKADVVNDSIPERTTALTFLLELWLYFPEVIESNTEYHDIIMHIFQRATRDKLINLQVLSISILFKLLTNFALERSPYALPVYKSITFALVENYQKLLLREFILENFKCTFDYCNTIPISILLEPLIKQISTSDELMSLLNLPELEFFACISRHSKLNANHGVQILGILTKSYIYNQVISTCILHSLLTISNRFKFTEDFNIYINELMQYVIGLYCVNVKKLKENVKNPLIEAQNGRIIRLIFIMISLDNTELNEYIKDLLIDGNRLVKSIIMIDDEELLELLEAMGEDKEIVNIDNNSVCSDNPNAVNDNRNPGFNTTETELKSLLTLKNSRPQLRKVDNPRSRSVLNRNNKGSNMKDPNESFAFHKANTIDQRNQSQTIDFNDNSLMATPKLHSKVEQYTESVITKRPKTNFSFNNRRTLTRKELPHIDNEAYIECSKGQVDNSLVPYTKPRAISNELKTYGKDPLEEKALIELEQLKMKRDEQFIKKQMEESKKLTQERNRNKILKQQLEIRKIEQNVATRNQPNIEQELLLTEGAYQKLTSHITETDVKLQGVDDEEEKDVEALRLFIERHKRILRYLFTKYSNSGFSSKPKSSFDELKRKLDTISIAEAIKMLKDHNITSSMISQAEISSLFRQVNFKIIHKHMLSLNYPGFIEFFIQVAIHIFSKDTFHNSLNRTPLDYVKLLLAHFKQAAKLKGESTILYENPDASTLGDPEVIQELTRCLNINPFYPLPEGYKKVEEKCVKENYAIPSNSQLPEKVTVCIELLDEILCNSLGIHILEPITTYEYITKVLPTIGKVYKQRTNEKSYMLPVTKRLRSNNTKQNLSLRQMNEKIMEPKLTATMKVVVATAKSEMKTIVKETAEVVAEIVDAVAANKTDIGTRMKWGPGFVLNKVVKEKLSKMKDEEMENEMKEQKRKLRAVLLKNTLQELKKDKLQKEQERITLLNKKKEMERAKSLKERELMKKRRKKLLEEKQRRVEEDRKKQIDESQNHELEMQRKAEQLKQLRKLKRERLKLELKTIRNDHEKKIMEKERKKHLEELKMERYQKTINDRLDKEKQKCIQLKEQKTRLQEFIERGDIEFTIARYRKPLKYIFQHFSRLENIQLAGSLTQSLNTLDLPKFSKFCLRFRLVPQLMLGEDVIVLFRQTVKAKTLVDNKRNDSQLIEYEDFEEILIRIALLLKNRINKNAEIFEGDLNKEYMTEGANANVLENLMNYINIRINDNKASLNKKLIKLHEDTSKVSIKNLFKRKPNNELPNLVRHNLLEHKTNTVQEDDLDNEDQPKYIKLDNVNKIPIYNPKVNDNIDLKDDQEDLESIISDKQFNDLNKEHEKIINKVCNNVIEEAKEIDGDSLKDENKSDSKLVVKEVFEDEKRNSTKEIIETEASKIVKDVLKSENVNISKEIITNENIKNDNEIPKIEAEDATLIKKGSKIAETNDIKELHKNEEVIDKFSKTMSNELIKEEDKVDVKEIPISGDQKIVDEMKTMTEVKEEPKVEDSKVTNEIPIIESTKDATTDKAEAKNDVKELDNNDTKELTKTENPNITNESHKDVDTKVVNEINKSEIDHNESSRVEDKTFISEIPKEEDKTVTELTKITEVKKEDNNTSNDLNNTIDKTKEIIIEETIIKNDKLTNKNTPTNHNTIANETTKTDTYIPITEDNINMEKSIVINKGNIYKEIPNTIYDSIDVNKQETKAINADTDFVKEDLKDIINKDNTKQPHDIKQDVTVDDNSIKQNDNHNKVIQLNNKQDNKKVEDNVKYNIIDNEEKKEYLEKKPNNLTEEIKKMDKDSPRIGIGKLNNDGQTHSLKSIQRVNLPEETILRALELQNEGKDPNGNELKEVKLLPKEL